ncbi:hypothetical protein BBK82_03540 [Lentzea guizhouensis]|uniref:Uncharacterized protein n=2 Tax=Lentzea guizhouensis TaxID=1586287 RepID=A0A1B2HC52_9PSEU|nr:hypothetical protein BBK82_03540 [Lentzea guizhouensis]
MTRSSVANFEAGRQHAPVAIAALCADVLLCDPGWLLSGRTLTPYPVRPALRPSELAEAVQEAEQLHRRLHDLANRLNSPTAST